jgi:hypothetical protein
VQGMTLAGVILIQLCTVVLKNIEPLLQSQCFSSIIVFMFSMYRVVVKSARDCE